MNYVSYRLATGAAIHNVEEVRELIARGITHIIDLRTTNAIRLLAGFTHARGRLLHGELDPGARLHYLHNGTRDDGRPKSPQWFNRSIRFALEALAHPGNRIYAHCAEGINRGPSTALAILLALGVDRVTARGMIVANRPQVGLRYEKDAWNAVHKLRYI